MDRIAHIAHICHAAHEMGIGLRESKTDEGFQFDWKDPIAGTFIIGPVAADRINAFELACNRLVDHLKFEPKNPPYETHR